MDHIGKCPQTNARQGKKNPKQSIKIKEPQLVQVAKLNKKKRGCV